MTAEILSKAVQKESPPNNLSNLISPNMPRSGMDVVRFVTEEKLPFKTQTLSQRRERKGRSPRCLHGKRLSDASHQCAERGFLSGRSINLVNNWSLLTISKKAA